MKSILLALFIPVSFLTYAQNASKGDVWIDSLNYYSDQYAETVMPRQMLDRTHDDFGGFPDQYDIYYPNYTAGVIERLTTVYASDRSSLFLNDTVLQQLQNAITFMLNHQHPDGTIDLLSTNFHSTPDLAFAIEPIARSFKILTQQGKQETQEVRDLMQTFLKRGGEALVVGGVHTPNHRWVVSMALSRLYDLFGDDRYVQRIDQWLDEGIDIDAEGQFTERSTGIYSPLTDRCFITIARLLDRPDLLDPVRKNLDMSMYYLHPNGEVVTEASRRQDQYRPRLPWPYYYPYRYMAIHDDNDTYGAIALQLQNQLGARVLSGTLSHFLEEKSLWRKLPLGEVPSKYERHFPESELVRFRDGEWDATILAKNSTLLTMHHANTVLQGLRISSAFFGKGQMIADTLILEEDHYTLRQELEGPYYQPFHKDSVTGDGIWEDMPRENREQSEVQSIVYEVQVTPHGADSMVVEIQLTGTDHVPVAVELSFREPGYFENTTPDNTDPSIHFLSEDYGSFGDEESRIYFGPGLKEHSWTALRGAEKKIEGKSVYLTGYTPFHHTLYIGKTVE